MNKNQVWKLVNRPKECPIVEKSNIVYSRWLFKRKTDAKNKESLRRVLSHEFLRTEIIEITLRLRISKMSS